jgi:hypothetical protein
MGHPSGQPDGYHSNASDRMQPEYRKRRFKNRRRFTRR